MKRLIISAFILIISVSISGCGFSKAAKVDKTSAMINELKLKSNKEDVVNILGPPDVRKAQLYGDGQLDILYYKTWTQTALIGTEYAAAFTPLYFYDDILLMIGDQVKAEYLDPIETMNAFKSNYPNPHRIDVFIHEN